MAMQREDANSLDDLLDEIQHLSGRNDEQRAEIEPRGSDVFLNVYDMLGLNHYLSYIGIGAFHSGVEVYGVEYAYGGHPYSYTGVYSMAPKEQDSVSTHGRVQFKQTVPLGYTSLSEAKVAELIQALGKEYNGNVYSVFSKNCNHFSGELCYKLTGKHIPHWVNRLAYVSSWMPYIVNCLPPSWVTSSNAAQGDEASTSTGFLCSPASLSQSRRPPSNSEETDC